VRVAFLGPAGTFAEEALRASAPGDAEIEEVPYASVYETVMAVQEGEVDRAVVPIENSLEGAVTATLDALAGEADRVRIAAEVVRPIEHCLVARPGLGIEAVRQVVSHPQAIAQCAGFLRERLPDAETASAPSTADAVRTAARATEPLAALGPRLAAELYGCDVLAEDVQDVSDNATRFVWLAPAGTSRGGADENVDRLLGLQRRVAGRAGARAERARGPGGEPDEDRIASTAGPPRALHVLRRPGRGDRRSGGTGGPRCALRARSDAEGAGLVPGTARGIASLDWPI